MSATEDIFSAITKQLEEGVVPWHKPWVARPSMIINHYNGKPYKGLRNRMLLNCAGEYATMHQINSEGGRVNKGSHGYRVFFSKSYKKKNDEDEEETRHVLRAFTVFHISDTTLQPKFEHIWKGEPLPEGNASDIVDSYAKRTGLGIRTGGDSAHYSPSHNYIIIPEDKDFETPEEFWTTVFHELGHSTARLCGRKYESAKEELVAEICACLCIGQLGMTPQIRNSAAYIAYWKSEIKDIKPNDFADACRSAEWAFKTIFNINKQENSNEQ